MVRYLTASVVIVGLLLASVPGLASDLPPPENYTAAGAGQELEGLRTAKVAWLTDQLARDKTILAAQKANGDNTTETQKAIDEHTKEKDALTEADDINPAKNTKAGEHAKLIKKNVTAWIKELESTYKALLLKAATETGDAKTADEARAKKVEASSKALEGDLDKAEQATPKLFN
jgi:hypothetical protein